MSADGLDPRGIEAAAIVSLGEMYGIAAPETRRRVWAGRTEGEREMFRTAVRSSLSAYLSAAAGPERSREDLLRKVGRLKMRAYRAEAEAERLREALRESNRFIATTTPWPGRDELLVRNEALLSGREPRS
jgi:hypothetical protein